MTGTASLRDLVTRNMRQSGIYIAFILIVALFAILTDGVLANPLSAGKPEPQGGHRPLKLRRQFGRGARLPGIGGVHQRPG